MKNFMLFGALGAVSLTSAACTQRDAAGNTPTDVVTADNAATTGDVTGADGTATTATADWPEGSRIVVEQGVTYRVNPDGTRDALSPQEGRIEVANGVRYRVDRAGTRVRIDERGAPLITTDVDAVGANVNAGMNVGGDTSVGIVTNSP